MSEIKNIYGIENEYSLTVSYPDGGVEEIVGQCHSADYDLGLYQEPEDNGVVRIAVEDFKHALNSLDIQMTENGMLSNGGRMYLDPSGPEYATSETTTAEEAVHRTFDGDEIILGVFKDLEKREIISGFQINRKCVDHNRSSRGVHLNHSTALSLKPESLDIKLVKNLASLNIVKGSIFGSGGLLLDEEGRTSFHHSPRLSLTDSLATRWEGSVPFAFKYRPLVRFPFKEDGDLNRIETVTSDALNFAWPLKASMVVTNSILRLIEAGYGDELPIVENPIRAALNVGQNGNQNQVSVKYPHKKRRGVVPSIILRDMCEIALKADDVEGFLDNESRSVLPEVIDVCEKINVDMYSVKDQVESVARLFAMERKMESRQVPLNSELMCRFDYAWDWIGGAGYAESLRKKNIVGWQGFKQKHSVSKTKFRIVTPPQDTRAKVRGDLIKESHGHNDSDWSNLDVGDREENFKMYFNPLKNKI